MMAARKSQRTVLHEVYESLDPVRKKVLFYLGCGFLALALIMASVAAFLQFFHPPEHAHALNVWSVGFIVVIFLMGFTLVAPRMALQLIAIIPLPPFLRRNGAKVVNYTGPERRISVQDFGGPDRRTSRENKAINT